MATNKNDSRPALAWDTDPAATAYLCGLTKAALIDALIDQIRRTREDGQGCDAEVTESVARDAVSAALWARNRLS